MTEPTPKLFLLSAPAQGDALCSPLSSRDDDELMLLARGGLRAAFDTLVQRHQARALRVAARHLGVSVLAPDVVQNAFLEIYQALPRYQARGRFASYFYRVLLNQCRMVHRSGRTRLASSAALPAEPPRAEAEILSRERERALAQALGSLSEKLRQVVLLRYSADLRYDEIADALELPVGTVKRRLFDAMAKLRSLLEEP